MNKERDSWERLITLKVLNPDSLYSPSRAKDGWYSATLRDQLKGLEQSPPADKTQAPLQIIERLRPDQVLAALPARLGGTPQRNVRTRYIEVNGRTISGNEGRHLYLELCNEFETWTKETTTDALEALADRNPFDPVLDYLDGLSCEPLPIE